MVEQQTATPSSVNPQVLDDVFHAIADRTRRDMLRRLAAGDQTISELAQPCAMSLAAASKHVRVLERAGLVRRTIRGRTHHCRLEARRLADAEQWLAFYQRFWSERFDALDSLLSSRAAHDQEKNK
jgi:DNA-binding transcriptional ArsR family regulator